MPLSNENATAERPTPSSAGSAQVPNSAVFACGHGAQSTKSFQPATRTFGWLASIATAGSFWWFCGVVSGGLPTLTSPPSAGPAVASAQTASAAATAVPKARRGRRGCFVLIAPPSSGFETEGGFPLLRGLNRPRPPRSPPVS